MATPNQSSTADQLIAWLKEISLATIAILAYGASLLRIPQLSVASSPSTTSVVTAIITMGVVTVWRWQRVSQQRIGEPPAEGVAPERLAGWPLLAGLLRDTLRATGKDRFVMPRRRRRWEVVGLTVLALATLGLTGTRFESMQIEITGFQCLSTPQGAPRFVIANFDGSTHNVFSDDIATGLWNSARSDIQVCRYDRLIHLVTEVWTPDKDNDLSERFISTLFIWGNQTSAGKFHVYLTPTPGQFPIGETFDTTLADSGDEPALFITTMATLGVFVQNKVCEAQRLLEDAIQSADALRRDDKNPRLLALANFWLGFYFDPDQSTGTSCTDLTAAIVWYSRAIDLDGTHDIYLLNRASLYDQTNEFGRALDDFESVLAHESTQAVLGGLLAGQAALKLMQYDRAINDAQAALELSVGPTGEWFADLMHTLGMAYLLKGDYSVGLSKYEQLPELDAETAQAFIDDLELIRDKSTAPGFSEAIDQAIAIIRL